jgi:hypothetical protein
MLVLSNQRIGPTAELMVSRDVGASLVRHVAEVARVAASSHWERELVRWLDERARWITSSTARPIVLDVGDIAFTPQHFDRQRRFLLDAIDGARTEARYARALTDWADLIKAHPRDSVQLSRRWIWHPNS